MYADEIANQQASGSRVLRDTKNSGAVMASGPNPNYREPSMAEMHGKSAAHHAEQVDKNSKAQTFFANHPEFDEFIQLVRQGAIQF